jgi:AcrR family transcriptional regulator
MVELVAEHGYNAVGVAMLTGRARTSKRDFYKHFSGKEECFLATYDVLVSRSVRGIFAAAEGEREWCERLRLGFLAFAGQIAGDPGEHNPEIDTIINAVRRLGVEFALDVAPAARKPLLVTARAQRQGAVAHDDVAVVAASALAT